MDYLDIETGDLWGVGMKIISFAWTTPALLAGRKTCTRRDWNADYARRFKSGELVQAYDKNPRAGGKKVGIIRLVGEPYYSDIMPEDDYDAEGLAWMEEQDLMVPVEDVKSKKKLPMHPRRFWEAWKTQNYKLWIIKFDFISEKGKPNKPCYRCGATEWWLRDNGGGEPNWVCGVCHPEPGGELNEQI